MKLNLTSSGGNLDECISDVVLMISRCNFNFRRKKVSVKKILDVPIICISPTASIANANAKKGMQSILKLMYLVDRGISRLSRPSRHLKFNM